MSRLVFTLFTIIQLLISGLVIWSGWGAQLGLLPPNIDRSSVRTEISQLADRQKIQIKDQTLLVEVARTSQELTMGLSGRTQIGSDGMLFVLPQPQIARFWMKDMKFDLDLVWISQSRIAAITADVPRPSVAIPDYKLPLYMSPPHTEMVLEVPAGTAEMYGWQEGDQVVLW